MGLSYPSLIIIENQATGKLVFLLICLKFSSIPIVGGDCGCGGSHTLIKTSFWIDFLMVCGHDSCCNSSLFSLLNCLIGGGLILVFLFFESAISLSVLAL